MNMSNKLFVGGLSWNTTSDELRRAFEAFCTVTDAKVISDRDTGRSRGFGFVTLADATELRATIEQMDGFMLDGRSLRVNEANDRPQTSSSAAPRRY
jgi:RNA recognition motif-containing protein